jgi:putative transposase
MPEKFQNKYRVPSARLKNWDYGNNGAYFITICTKEMMHFFGEVTSKNMNLNSIGELAEENWVAIVKQFPYVELGSFQIMPNHMHGILIINKGHESSYKNLETRLIKSVPQNALKTGGFAKEGNPMVNENISRIIRWYKGRCTFQMRKLIKDFEWHSRFYDHIIRNSESFERIQMYIEENPAKWAEDKFYKK